MFKIKVKLSHKSACFVQFLHNSIPECIRMTISVVHFFFLFPGQLFLPSFLPYSLPSSSCFCPPPNPKKVLGNMSGMRVDAKVVMLGKESVGKTSLVERYVHHRFLVGPYQNVRFNARTPFEILLQICTQNMRKKVGYLTHKKKNGTIQTICTILRRLSVLLLWPNQSRWEGK